MTAEMTPENALVQALSAVDPIEQMRSVVLAAREHDSLISRRWVSGWTDQWEQERAALAEKCRRLEEERIELRRERLRAQGQRISAQVARNEYKERAEQAEAERDSVREEAARIERENIEGWKQASVWRQAAQQAVEERDAAVKYREAVFDGNAVFMALAKTSHAACSISAIQVSEVLDAVNRVANSGEPKCEP